MQFDDTFIGQGWQFPPKFDLGTGAAEMSTGIRDIEESLRIIFSTQLGERIMRPDFGCDLNGDVFTGMHTSHLAWLETMIKNAILYHEPRINAERINLRPDHNEGLLMIELSYHLRADNSRHNFVHPFYLGDNDEA